MANPSNSAVQNLLPVQAYFDAQDNFITFIGQGKPFYATSNPVQSGLTITNSTLNSSPIGGTSPSTGVFTNISTTTGTISTQPTGATDIVNLLALQSYAAGISWKQPCAVATLTNITLSGLQTIDSYTTLAGDRVLVKNQTNAANNGIYIAASGAWTRSLDADAWQEFVSAISFIEYGTQAGGAWFCTATPGGTLGVTAINWSQFTTSATYSAGTGLTLTGSVFSITNTGVAANTYGSATASPVFAVNAQGQITSVTNTTITPAVGSITGLGTGVATFLATPTSANLAAAVTDETGTGSLVFATSPTLVTPALGTPASGVMTNVTGLPLTTGVTGTLAIGNGGTGQTTASTAFNALSPITTAGDLIIGNGANSATRLGIGTNNYVLTSNGTTATWAAVPSSMVYPSAGIPNSTGTAWGTSYSTTGSGTVVALAISPVFVTPTLGAASATSINTSGTETAGAFVANKVITGSLNAGAFSYGTLAYSDIDIFSSYTLNVNNYVQKILQNTNSGTAASADFVISNNLGTASTYYGDFGITSSGYNTPGQNITNTPNTVYLQAVTTGLAIGTLNSNTVTFYANSTQSAQIGTGGGWTFVNDASISGLTVGKGGGSITSNTVLGAGGALSTNVSGTDLTAIGRGALSLNTASYNSAFGRSALENNSTGANNTAVGYQSLVNNTTASNNTAVGYQALYSNTTAQYNDAFGYLALKANTTGATNSAFGNYSLQANTTGSQNVAVGQGVLYSNTTASNNTGVGYSALTSNTTGANNTALGEAALTSNTTANNNTAVGYQAGYSTTSGPSNTYLGYQAGYTATNATGNIFIGYQAGYTSNYTANTKVAANICVGHQAGYSLTTGTCNTFIGANPSDIGSAGYYVTTGSNNVILGAYTGNNGGLDIRTANNYVVLSDGQGNPRGWFDNNGNYFVGQITSSAVAGSGTSIVATQSQGGNQCFTGWNQGTSGTRYLAYFGTGASFTTCGSIYYNGTVTVYATTSDQRLKDNIVDAGSGLAKLANVKIRAFDWKESGNHTDFGVIAQELHEIAPEAVGQGVDKEDGTIDKPWSVDTAVLVPAMIKAIQELKAEIDALKAAK